MEAPPRRSWAIFLATAEMRLDTVAAQLGGPSCPFVVNRGARAGWPNSEGSLALGDPNDNFIRSSFLGPPFSVTIEAWINLLP